jgi:hypothetical protein
MACAWVLELYTITCQMKPKCTSELVISIFRGMAGLFRFNWGFIVFFFMSCHSMKCCYDRKMGLDFTQVLINALCQYKPVKVVIIE